MECGSIFLLPRMQFMWTKTFGFDTFLRYKMICTQKRPYKITYKAVNDVKPSCQWVWEEEEKEKEKKVHRYSRKFCFWSSSNVNNIINCCDSQSKDKCLFYWFVSRFHVYIRKFHLSPHYSNYMLFFKKNFEFSFHSSIFFMSISRKVCE